VAQRHIDAITTYRQDRLKPARRHPGLVEPADHLIDLGHLAMGRHPRTQTAQELPQGGTRPVHPMVMLYHLQHLALRMIRSPASNTLGQRRSGHTSFHTQGKLQGMDGTQPWHQRFIEPPPDDYGTEQRGKRGAMLPAATIGLSLEPQARRHLVRVVGLHVIQDPGDNAAAHLP
jgi:hypothetical protein